MNKKIIAAISAAAALILGFLGFEVSHELIGFDVPWEESAAQTEVSKSDTPPTHIAGSLISHYIDVGQGDCEFIELPDGKTLLIDAGTYESGETVKSYIKSLGYTSIDYVVGTHPHSDHIGGLADVIKTFDIGQVYLPKAENNTKTFENLLNAISSKKKKVKTAKSGVRITSCDEPSYTVDIIAPISKEYEDLNNYSAVIKIKFKNRSFLYMGDAEALVEKELLGKNTDLSADVVKVGHHGSSSSSSDKFVKATGAEYAIFSLGKNNDYGHPHNSTVKRWKKYNAIMYRTDECGSVTIYSDGDSLNVHLEKQPESSKKAA